MARRHYFTSPFVAKRRTGNVIEAAPRPSFAASECRLRRHRALSGVWPDVGRQRQAACIVTAVYVRAVLHLASGSCCARIHVYLRAMELCAKSVHPTSRVRRVGVLCGGCGLCRPSLCRGLALLPLAAGRLAVSRQRRACAGSRRTSAREACTGPGCILAARPLLAHCVFCCRCEHAGSRRCAGYLGPCLRRLILVDLLP